PRRKALFGDDDHSINGEMRPSQGEGFLDTWVNLHAVAARAVMAEVAFRDLGHVEPGHLDGGMVVLASPAIALQETVQELLGVRIFSHLSGQEGDFLASRRSGMVRLIERRTAHLLDGRGEGRRPTTEQRRASSGPGEA